MAGFTYKSYNFIDKDPLIDEIRTVFDEAQVTYKWVEDESGVTAKTLSKWFDGKTKRPQAATINAVLRALGYKLGVVPHSVPVRFRPTAEQPPHSVRHVVQMAKYKRGKHG
jgi:hypothetical protein